MAPVRFLISLVIVFCSVRLPAQVEVPVSSIEYGPADHAQFYPVAAGGGEGFLVAWNTTDFVTATEAYATRLSLSGEVLDRPALRLPAISWVSAVAWTGRVFLVAGTLPGHRGMQILTIDPDGTVANGAVLENRSPTSLTCHATRCLLTVIDAIPFDQTLYGVVLDLDGNVIGEPQLIAKLPGTAFGVAAATNGANFLVTWYVFDPDLTPRWKLYVATVSSAGFPGPSRLTSVPEGGYAIAAASGTYVLAWNDGTNITAQRISSDGVPIGDVRRSPVPGLVRNGLGLLLSTGNGFLGLGVDSTHRLISFPLSSQGEPLAEPTMVTGAPVSQPFAAALASGQVLVAWSDADVYARLLTPSGQPNAERTLLAESARRQGAPSMVWDGQRVATVWQELIDGRHQIRMSILDDAVSRRHELTVDSDNKDQRAQRIAFNGSEYLVVWREISRDGAAIEARRFSKMGEPLDDQAILLTAGDCGTEGPAIASDGADFLVSWTDCSGGERLVVASRIVGGVVADRLVVSAGGIQDAAGGVAWDGRNYVVVWLDQRARMDVSCDPVPCYLSTVRASRITRSGFLLDPAGIAMSSEGSIMQPEAIAADGSVLVAWRSHPGIAGARLFAGGTKETPRLLVSQFSIFNFSMAWDGAQFVAAWTTNEYPYAGEILAARISPQQIDMGTGATPIPLARTADIESAPAVIATGPRRVTLAYQRSAREPQYGNANRVFLRSLYFIEGRRRAARN